MAPRKRRARTGVPLPPPSASPSATNSIATSSPSPRPLSKSDNDSTERVPPSRHRFLKSVVPDVPYAPPKLRSARGAHVERSVSADADDLRNVTPSAKDAIRLQQLIKAFDDGHKSMLENGDITDKVMVADVVLRLYDDMINWAVTDAAVQFKCNAFLAEEGKRCAAAFTSANGNKTEKGRHEKRRAAKVVPGGYGSRLLYSDKNVTVECSNCGSNISASRYAQHVEKCLGRGGRMSSRAASARMRASAERAEKEAAADMEDQPARRRRHGSGFSDMESTSGFGMGGGSKRRKMSPVPSGASAAISQGSLAGRAGLPPSGRTRGSPP